MGTKWRGILLNFQNNFKPVTFPGWKNHFGKNIAGKKCFNAMSTQKHIFKTFENVSRPKRIFNKSVFIDLAYTYGVLLEPLILL